MSSCPGRLRSARMGSCVLDSECAQDRECGGRAAVPAEASAQGEMLKASQSLLRHGDEVSKNKLSMVWNEYTTSIKMVGERAVGVWLCTGGTKEPQTQPSSGGWSCNGNLCCDQNWL